MQGCWATSSAGAGPFMSKGGQVETREGSEEVIKDEVEA